MTLRPYLQLPEPAWIRVVLFLPVLTKSMASREELILKSFFLATSGAMSPLSRMSEIQAEEFPDL